jgi:ribose transport system ATP-binding protein
MDSIIQFDQVGKVFPGQVALRRVSFGIERGECHALLGENGAGKSTLLNVLHGIFPPTSGDIVLDGSRVRFSNAREAIACGIAKVHQEINLIPDMTVTENLMLGSETVHLGFLQKKQMRERTTEVLQRLHCDFSPDLPVRKLSVWQKQMLQIAKALLSDARVISFDEPTSSLSNAEVRTLFEVIGKLRAQGITVLYVTHKLDEVYELCDRATILRDGEYQGTVRLSQTSRQDLIRRMVGRDVSLLAKRQLNRCVRDRVALQAKGITVERGQPPVSFEVRMGEVLGFFGLVGALRSETMEGVFGERRLLTGTIINRGRSVRYRSPREAIVDSVAMLPENRKERGFIADMNNADNIALPALKKFRTGIFQSDQKKLTNAIERGEQVRLSPNRPKMFTRYLSGGNQQKAIIAKWLTIDADIVIFDEPTKGIDVGAKTEIYQLMEEMAHEGKAIIMISSELPEVMGLSDRIMVMRAGAVTAEFAHDEFSEEAILAAAVTGEES